MSETTQIITSSNSPLLIFKIGKYLPFIFLNITYVELGIHIVISFISYFVYILIIYTIFKLQKFDSLYKSIFYNVTIILGIVEILGHFFQFLLFYEVRISPLVDYFVIHSPPAWQFTVIINGVGFGLISQASYSFYLSLIRFVAVFFPLSAKMTQEKSYFISHILIIILCCSIILCSPLYYGNYMVDLDEFLYTQNKSTGTYLSNSLFFDRSNRHTYTTTLTGIFTVTSSITNLFTYFKFNGKMINTFLTNNSLKVQRKNEKNMNLFVICLTLKQLMFLCFNILQLWKPKIQNYDNSIYQITQALKPWIMHINFFFSAYAILYFNKKIKLELVNIILFKKNNKTINTKSGLITTRNTCTKKQKKTIF